MADVPAGAFGISHPTVAAFVRFANYDDHGPLARPAPATLNLTRHVRAQVEIPAARGAPIPWCMPQDGAFDSWKGLWP
jgi:hypothetical protein